MNLATSRTAWVIMVTMFLALSTSGQSAPEVIKLWPGTAPGEKGDIGVEKDLTKDTENLIAGKRLIRLGNVSEPTLTIYRPPAGKETGAAVVVCPGGGYHILALDLEGTEVCEWLNSIGVTAVLLKYRVPVRKDQERWMAPLQDAQRAMGVVRLNASKWGIDPKRIGIMGFSAGGHLSAAASTIYDKRAYETLDEADKTGCRPDFTLLIYPAYLVKKDAPTEISPELKLDANVPPMFIVQTQDDGVGAENSIYFSLALRAAKVPPELHIYPKGGHGYGLRRTEQAVTFWPQRAEEWMRELGLLTKK